MFKFLSFLVPLCLIGDCLSKPTIYEKNEDNIFEPVMIPVSSTVIPIPVYKVGYGYGFVSKDKKTQATYNPNGQIKLITVSGRLREITLWPVQQYDPLSGFAEHCLALTAVLLNDVQLRMLKIYFRSLVLRISLVLSLIKWIIERDEKIGEMINVFLDDFYLPLDVQNLEVDVQQHSKKEED